MAQRSIPPEQRTITSRGNCGCTFFGEMLYGGCTEATRLRGVVNYYRIRQRPAQVERYLGVLQDHLSAAARAAGGDDGGR
jgi:hypothetical protein